VPISLLLSDVMILIKKLLNQLSPYSFLIKFLLFFGFLYLLFPFFRGVTAQEGGMYSPFVDNYFNIVKAFTTFLTSGARMLLELFQYEPQQLDYQSLRIGTSAGIIVNPSCLGWGVMSFWTAFVVANGGGWQHKLKWTVMGLLFIIILNISRLALITLALFKHWQTIRYIDHHFAFNILSYCIIGVLILWFISRQKKYETRKLQLSEHNG
jgi:exosortase/archaeosortase family protein